MPKKSKTPPPPRRPVQAPKLRTTSRDPGRNRMLLAVIGGSALLVAAAVAAFVFLGGGEGQAATDDRLRDAGCEVQTVQAAENFMNDGKKLAFRHLPNDELPEGFEYNTTPPTSGVHTDATIVYGIYDEEVPTISTVHNLEHGAVVIRYGEDVPDAEVAKLREFYLDDPNGLVVAPMPELGRTIALTAWTFDQGRRNDRAYEGEGRLAKCTTFNADAFEAFVDAYRAKGPEPFELEDLQPGGP